MPGHHRGGLHASGLLHKDASGIPGTAANTVLPWPVGEGEQEGSPSAACGQGFLGAGSAWTGPSEAQEAGLWGQAAVRQGELALAQVPV